MTDRVVIKKLPKVQEDTRKVVINACFGGFQLSYEAVMEYAKRKGLDLRAYVTAREKGDGIVRGNRKDGYVRYNGDGTDELCIHYSTKPLLRNGQLASEGYFSYNDIPRDDIDLVAVVEKMGEKASGDCSELKVVEIPADVKWEIDEYDGQEHVQEAHRQWC